MAVIPSSAQAAYDRASAPRKLAAPRIAASLDALPLTTLEDPDRGPLEAVEARGLNATGADFTELEVSGSRFSNCLFQACSFTGALFVDIAFEGCDFSNSTFDSAAFTRCTFKDCKFAGASFTEALWEHVVVEGCTFAFSSADMSEMELRAITLDDDRFIGTSFFRTKLTGLDLTSCQLKGIVVSDTMGEVFGAKLSLYQAAALARRLGIIIEE